MSHILHHITSNGRLASALIRRELLHSTAPKNEKETSKGTEPTPTPYSTDYDPYLVETRQLIEKIKLVQSMEPQLNPEEVEEIISADSKPYYEEIVERPKLSQRVSSSVKKMKPISKMSKREQEALSEGDSMEASTDSAFEGFDEDEHTRAFSKSRITNEFSKEKSGMRSISTKSPNAGTSTGSYKTKSIDDKTSNQDRSDNLFVKYLEQVCEKYQKKRTGDSK